MGSSEPTLGKLSAHDVIDRRAYEMLSETSLLDEKLLLDALRGLKNGDFSVRLPAEWTGVPGKIADVFNDFVEMNETIVKSVEVLGHAVGRQGRVTQRVDTGNVRG